MLWLLSGIVQMLDVKCFYYHLREDCKASIERARRFKQALNTLRAQTYDLRENLVYCSPLGAFLQSLRRSKTGAHPGWAFSPFGRWRRAEFGVQPIWHA